MIKDNIQNNVIKDSLRIMAALNKHLSEESCGHSIKEIVIEAFEAS